MCTDPEIGTMGNRCGKTGGQSSSTLLHISCLREGERKKDNMLSRIVLSNLRWIDGIGGIQLSFGFVGGCVCLRRASADYYLRWYRLSSGLGLGSGSWVGDTAYASLAVPSSLCLAWPSSIELRRRRDCVSNELGLSQLLRDSWSILGY